MGSFFVLSSFKFFNSNFCPQKKERCGDMRSHMTLRPFARFFGIKHGLVVVVIKTLCRLYYLVCALNSVTLHAVSINFI